MIKTQREKLNLLIKAFEERNEKEFEFYLEAYAINSNASLESLGIDTSIIEYVLKTPKSSNFIRICLDYGEDFYKKNHRGLYLIHYAIQSMCAENLLTLIDYLNKPANSETQKNESCFMSYKSQSSNINNYLHDVIEKMTKENYENCLKIVEMLLNNGCNPNHLNVESKSPFEMLLEKITHDFPATEMIELFLDNSVDAVEICDSEKYVTFVKELNISEKVKIRNMDYLNNDHLLKILKQGNENEFVTMLGKVDASQMSANYAELIKSSIEMNFTKGVRSLLEYSRHNPIDKNGHSQDLLISKCPMTQVVINEKNPLFYALSLCRYEIVEEFLKFNHLDSIMISNGFKCRNVLHEICSLKNVESNEDLIKCFNLLIKDKRCDEHLINAFDCDSKTPLMYACENDHKELILELLRRGAYIGHDNIINIISENILKEYLDECILPASDINDQNCKVQINFSSLIPPKRSDDRNKEMKALKLISLQSKFKSLITHPALTSFLELKWKRVNFLIYGALFLYFICFVYLSVFILNFFNHDIYNRPDNKNSSDEPNFFPTRFGEDDDNQTSKNITSQNISILKILFGKRRRRDLHDQEPEVIASNLQITDVEQYIKSHRISYIISLLVTVALTIGEIVQFVFSRKKYFLKLSNWVDLTLLSLAYIVLLNSFDYHPDTFRKLRAILFLVIALQSFILLAMVSKLSLQLEIFKKVSKTFLKILLFYFMLIFAFAMAFYTLHHGEISSDEDGNPFENILLSTITVIRMMLSDFDGIKLDPDNQFNSIIFLTFVLLITIILFNLLNALAITDTQEIIKFAETVDVRKRITIVNNCERILAFLNIDFFNIYSKLIRNGRIVLKINRDNCVRIKDRSAQIFSSVKFSKNQLDADFVEVANQEAIKTVKYSKVFVPQLIPFDKLNDRLKSLKFLNPKLTLGSENVEKIAEHIKNLMDNDKQAT